MRRVWTAKARGFGAAAGTRPVPMVYAASSLALAVLEVLVHLPPAMRRTGGLPVLTAVALDLPEVEVATAMIGPEDRATGDSWAAAGTSLALRHPQPRDPLRVQSADKPASPEYPVCFGRHLHAI